jgi:hypothetical protein
MASTTFIDNQTVIYASWLNDVNNVVYNGIFQSASITATSVICNGTASGAGFTNLINNTFTAPGPIGSVTPSTGKFTTLQATSLTGLTTPLSASQGGTGISSPGTAGNLLTSNGSAWVSSAPVVIKGLGLAGETWHTTGKGAGTSYTNSNSYPIMVSVAVEEANTGYDWQAFVNGLQISRFFGYTGGGSGASQTFSFIVPPGNTYQVNVSNGTVIIWDELY